MSICLYASGKAIIVATSLFTLSWTHSVEKVRWEEDWRLADGMLVNVEARIRGTGAGMEIPEGAVVRDGVWTYTPNLEPQRALLLARSGATGGGWEVCGEAGCQSFGAEAGDPAEIRACRSEN